jgi:hypothetical protein
MADEVQGRVKGESQLRGVQVRGESEASLSNIGHPSWVRTSGKLKRFENIADPSNLGEIILK